MADAPHPRGLPVQLAGHDFLILPERALYWPEQRMLMIADLHLGKSDVFRAAGISVPLAVQLDDLTRLNGLLAALQPASLVILGDFVHGALVGDQTYAAWQNLRAAHPATRFILTRGNHDRHLPSAAVLDEVAPRCQISDVLLTHEPVMHATVDSPFALNIHGHIHPIFRAKSWPKALPAMVRTENHLALPAFSRFTAGQQIHSNNSECWVFGDEDDSAIVQVLPVTTK